MTHYQLVYDARTFDPGLWSPLAMGAGFMVIGVVLILFSRKDRTQSRSGRWPPRPAMAWFWFLFAALWTGLSGYALVTSWLRVQNALSSETYRVVSGQVEDFVPMPVTGHAHETFTLEGVHFNYSDFGIRPGYRNTESHGGVIHKDSVLRVGYICEPSEADCSNPLIVRLEVDVSREQGTSQAASSH